MNGTPTDLISRPWTRQSEYIFVHRTGARIERRGYPVTPGWYLVPDKNSPDAQRYDPTPQGCDEAFIAFSARLAT